jgi:hypothetical protein
MASLTLNLDMPKRKHTKEKLQAYKRHWDAISRVQDEFNSRWIHEGASDTAVSRDSQISHGTVRRFRQWGRGAGKTSYSYFHGPAATTIFGIADALGLEIKIVPKRRQA